MRTASGMYAMANSSDCGAEEGKPGPNSIATVSTSKGIYVGSADDMNCAALARLLAGNQLTFSKFTAGGCIVHPTCVQDAIWWRGSYSH